MSLNGRKIVGEGLEYAGEEAGGVPLLEASFASSCRGVRGWQVVPSSTGSDHPEDAVEYVSVRDARASGGGSQTQEQDTLTEHLSGAYTGKRGAY